MIIYLAQPYTFAPDYSFDQAKQIAAKLMRKGHVVFSPIVHSHPVCEYLDDDLKLDHEFWMNQDLPILEKCDMLLVVLFNDGDGAQLVRESRGCMKEINHAATHKIPINWYDVENDRILTEF